MVFTVQELRRLRRLQERRRAKIARVITTMERGCSLNLMFTKNGSVYTLSNGERVKANIAIMVTRDVRVISVNDGLFPQCPQTWRFADRFL